MLFSSRPYGLFSGLLHQEPNLLIILNYLYLQILTSLLSQLLPHSNPPCSQLSLLEETEQPGEKPQLSAERVRTLPTCDQMFDTGEAVP